MCPVYVGEFLTPESLLVKTDTSPNLWIKDVSLPRMAGYEYVFEALARITRKTVTMDTVSRERINFRSHFENVLKIL